MIPKREFTPRELPRTVRFRTRWALWNYRRSGVAFLLGFEALAVGLCLLVATHANADPTVITRLSVLVGMSVVYAEVTDRVERVWIWLHTERGVWVGQGSILCFAGVLVLPTWAAVLQAVLAYAHIGIRNKRFATAPAHRWVWSAATVVLATCAASSVYQRFGGAVEHVGVADLLIILAAAALYSWINLAVLVAGIYTALRPPSVRSLLPDRTEYTYEAAKLLLAAVAAVLLVQTPILTPAVLVFAALLHRSTLVTELRTVASTDDKTGLLTYRAWSEQATASLAACADARRPAAVVLLDLDHFKRLNDTLGHAAGDRALAGTGAVLAEEIRVQDCVGRYGGEEFVVFLPGASEARAVEIAQRLRERIAADDSSGACVTASFGVAAVGPNVHTLEQLVEAADAAMYAAKSRGRNTVCAASAA